MGDADLDNFEPARFQYRAFLSYSRADQKTVDEVFKLLQRFRTPRSLRKTHGTFGALPTSLNTFLDRKSAQLGATVPDRLKEAIQNSAFLIVFCSEASAKSFWVAEEIKEFLKCAPAVRILPVFVRDNVETQLSSLSPPPLAEVEGKASIGADLLQDGGVKPVSHKIIGALLGISQDKVAREQELADRRRRRTERIALTTIAGLATVSSIAGWIAYDRAKSAQQSMMFAVNTLDGTTPFTRELLQEGRITTEKALSLTAPIGAIATASTSDISRLEKDIQFGVGQVLVDAAALHGLASVRETELELSGLANATLTQFSYDPGPIAQEIICDAQLQYAAALAGHSRYEEALRLVDKCDRLALDEIEFAQGDHAEIGMMVGLLARRVQSQRLAANIANRADRFDAALSFLNAALSPERLGELSSVDARAAAMHMAGATVQRGNIHIRLEDYDEAARLFAEAETLYASNAADPLDDALLQDGWIQLGQKASDDAGIVLARIDTLLSRLNDQITIDPTIRALRARRSSLLVERANILADRKNLPSFESNMSTAIADLDEAGEINAGLLEFDPLNVYWRTNEAIRLSTLGDIHFRIWEQEGDTSSLCGADCLDVSASRFHAAWSLMSKIENPSPSRARYRGDIELRVARSLRHAGKLDAAQSWVARAQATVASLHQSPGPLPPDIMLKARVLDETADLFEAQGEHDQALPLRRDVVDITKGAVAAQPNWITMKRDLVWGEISLAETLVSLAQEEEARSIYLEACTVLSGLAVNESRLLEQDRVRLTEDAARIGASCDQ